MSLIAFNGPLYHKLAAFLPILPCFSYCNNIPSFYNYANYANYASLSRWNLCFHHFEPTLVTNIIAKTRAFLVPILVNDLPWSHSRPANASYHVSKLASRLQISPWQHHHPGFNCLSIPPGTIISPTPLSSRGEQMDFSWLMIGHSLLCPTFLFSCGCTAKPTGSMLQPWLSNPWGFSPHLLTCIQHYWLSVPHSGFLQLQQTNQCSSQQYGQPQLLLMQSCIHPLQRVFLHDLPGL